MDSLFDTRKMARALQLARRGRFWAAPNPHVGCVLTRAGTVIGEGFTQPAGSHHAEVEALRAAGDARGATAYVTLEPCSHRGRTGPCAQALAEAGVARVVVAMADPNPQVNGKGWIISILHHYFENTNVILYEGNKEESENHTEGDQ